MAANVAPIYTLIPVIGAAVWLPATTANVKSDGTGTVGTDILLLLTGGTNGSFINKIRLIPAASAAATATTPTVARAYLSTVSASSTTSANTHLFAEVPCPAQTADQTTTAISSIEIPCGFYIPSTQSILVSMHHAAATSTAWKFLCFAGNY